MKWLKNIGPGMLVSAAFIGPGTVTVCTLAGVNFQSAGFLTVMALIVMGEYRNSLIQNIFGFIIFAITIFLGAKSIYTVLQ